MTPAQATSTTRAPDTGSAPPLEDLTTRANVHDLVVDFYREIVFDELLEPVFDEVAEVDWASHIPRLIDYWCRILFGTKEYVGQVTAVHRHLHSLDAVRPEHCDRWYSMWIAAVDRQGDQTHDNGHERQGDQAPERSSRLSHAQLACRAALSSMP